MRKKKKSEKFLTHLLNDHYWICALILWFVHFKVKYFVTRYHFPVWDEAVYIAMSKFFYSFGASGYLETLRPILWPLILGPFRLVFDNYMAVYELISLFFGMLLLYLTYRLGKELFNGKVGFIAALLVAFSPTFFQYSSFILTGIPSTCFILLALFSIIKYQKYGLAGFFTGLAFLTRFPQALFCVAVGVILLRRILKEKDKDNKREVIKDGLRYGIGALLTVLPFFIFNFIYYQKDTSSWYHATFRPLIFASGLINNTYLWLYESQYTYFFTGMFNENILFALFFVGVALMLFLRYKNKRKLDGTKDYLLLATLIVILAYFTQLPRKEFRYVLSFLPYVALYASFALYTVLELLYKSKNTVKKVLAMVLVVLCIHSIHALHVENSKIIHYRGTDVPPIVAENYEFLQKNPVAGSVITTDPLLGVFIDNKIIPAYYSMQDLEHALQTYDYSAIYLVPRAFPCQETDVECNERKKKIVGRMLLDNHLIYDGSFNDVRYHILTKEDYFTRLSKEELFLEYDLTSAAKLSSYPDDEYPIVLILEDYPSLDDTKTNIWHKEEFEWMHTYFEEQEITPSLAVIPTHLQQLDTVAPEALVKIRSHAIKGGELLQNGLTHTDELKGDKWDQMDAIEEGREIIANLTGYESDGFIPPFYSANGDTIKALEDLGYDNYVTNIGDSTDAGQLMRFDQSFTLIANWAEKTFKTPELVEQELHYIKSFNPYLMVSLYYYMYEENTRESLEHFINLIKDDRIMSVSSLSDWLEFRDRVYFTIDANEITITATDVTNDQAELLTILLFGDGTFSIDSDIKQLKIKNAIDEPIEACFNEKCYTLQAQQLETIFV